MIELNNAGKILQDICEKAKAVGLALGEVVKKWRTVVNMTKIALICTYTENPRVKHLALNAKKAKTRKKNYHRILKERRR